MTPQQIINDAREEFEKKFGNVKLMAEDDINGVPFTDYGLFDDIKSFLTSTLQSFIESEIAREEGEKKPLFTGHVGNDTSRAYDMGRNEGYNQAKEETIPHLKELLGALKR